MSETLRNSTQDLRRDVIDIGWWRMLVTRRRPDGSLPLRPEALLPALLATSSPRTTCSAAPLRPSPTRSSDSLCRPFYSHTGQPSVDPLVFFKMLPVGYLYGITSERRLAQEVELQLAYR